MVHFFGIGCNSIVTFLSYNLSRLGPKIRTKQVIPRLEVSRNAELNGKIKRVMLQLSRIDGGYLIYEVTSNRSIPQKMKQKHCHGYQCSSCFKMMVYALINLYELKMFDEECHVMSLSKYVCMTGSTTNGQVAQDFD